MVLERKHITSGPRGSDRSRRILASNGTRSQRAPWSERTCVEGQAGRIECGTSRSTLRTCLDVRGAVANNAPPSFQKSQGRKTADSPANTIWYIAKAHQGGVGSPILMANDTFKNILERLPDHTRPSPRKKRRHITKSIQTHPTQPHP